ncbi:winged helix-turn-helix transcriptional regulator [Candidatus Dojkabacteria bacterium]|nr:winged helix-turn-helix transcriptional regulator [Candidatus Dojkabacteria bacterium]
MDFEITPKILDLVSKIYALQERFSGLPLEASWEKHLQEDAVVADTIATYKLDGGKVKVKGISEILGLKSIKDRQILLNEYEIRKSFGLYFKSKELKIEDVNYVHRLLDNLHDETAQERGNFRKEQEVLDIEAIPDLLEKIPRYGFIRREVESLLEQLNENGIHMLIVAGLIHLGLVKISPYQRSNFRVARAIGKGYMFANGFDSKQFLALDAIFALDIARYRKNLEAGLDGNTVLWLEYFLEQLLHSFRELAERIKGISAGSVRPLEKEVIPLTKRQRTIIELLKKNAQMSGSEVATVLGVTRQNIHVIMQKLLKKRIVEKVGKGTSSRYKLKII